MSNNTPEQQRRRYHRRRVTTLTLELEKILYQMQNFRLSSTTAAEHAKLEKRRERVDFMLRQSRDLEHTVQYAQRSPTPAYEAAEAVLARSAELAPDATRVEGMEDWLAIIQEEANKLESEK